MKHMLDTLVPNSPGEFDAIYGCVDCLETFDHWPSDNLPESECAGVPTPMAQAVHDATTGLPDSVKKRMMLALGWVDPEPNNPFHRSVSDREVEGTE